MSVKFRGAVPSSSVKRLIKEPLVFTAMNTEFETPNGLRSLSCLSDQEFWTIGEDNLIRLYNLDGNLVKAFQTETGNVPEDITVTRNGDLVYTDDIQQTVNVVSNQKIKKLTKLSHWMPRGICSASTGDFLVIMSSKSDFAAKVVRYSGSRIEQIIGLPNRYVYWPTFSSGTSIKSQKTGIKIFV